MKETVSGGMSSDTGSLAENLCVSRKVLFQFSTYTHTHTPNARDRGGFLNDKP